MHSTSVLPVPGHIFAKGRLPFLLELKALECEIHTETYSLEEECSGLTQITALGSLRGVVAPFGDFFVGEVAGKPTCICACLETDIKE